MTRQATAIQVRLKDADGNIVAEGVTHIWTEWEPLHMRVKGARPTVCEVQNPNEFSEWIPRDIPQDFEDSEYLTVNWDEGTIVSLVDD